MKNVGTTSDPESIPLKSQVDAKQDTLVSGDNIKTVNGESLLGAGNVAISGLSYFQETRSVTAPNATVPVHALTPVGIETNIDFAIVPKGTGAIVAQVPDGTATGGDKRGVGAVDLQMSRTAATQVVTGQYAFSVGAKNTVGGPFSVAMGQQNTTSNQAAIAIGVYNNATSSNSIAIGSNNTSSAVGAMALGYYNNVNGSNSFAIGYGLEARGVKYAIIEGVSLFSARGSTQMGRYAQRRDLSVSTPTQLTANTFESATANPDVSNVPTMPNNSAYYCRVRVLARNTVTNEVKSWEGKALVKRGVNAASTTLVGSTITSDYGDAAMSACAATLVADTTRGCLAVMAAGIDGVLIRWGAQIETVEVA